MSEKTKDKIPILNINGISDIHYEKQSDFASSIHSAAYKRACRITREIISEAEGSGYVNEMKSNFDRSTDLRNREQVCNILFFTGEKGTGKTSTMLSFMEFLKDYHRISRKENGMQGDFSLGGGPYMFTGIEYIDASALNEKEDILGNVLSKMLSKWKGEEERGRYLNSGIIKGSDYDYKKKRMYIQCEELFDRLKALKSAENVMDNDSDMFIESMESLSFSWNLKNSFQKLVESYLDIMVYPDSGKEISRENHYLVISIDDVDMNVQSGFMLLEQIRKYLMVPNVLVLMSANYEQLEKICYQHYLKEFDKLERDDESIRYLQKISREYLEKMAPVQRQVELRSNRNWEFFSEKKFIIQYKGEKVGQRNLDKEGKEKGQRQGEESTLCEIVSESMYKHFGLWFGSDKRCIYYLAPDTIREICSWVARTHGLAACFQDGCCTDPGGYGENMHWFMLSEFPRLCGKYLDPADSKIIRMLDILDPAWQVKKVREALCSKMNLDSIGKASQNSKKIQGSKMNRAREQSLLKLFADAKTGYEDAQNFASLCLIYFSMKLQQTAVQMRTEPDKAALLLRYYSIGGWGVWGTWERDMLAPMAKMDTVQVKSKTQTAQEEQTIQKQVLKGFCRIGRSEFKKDNDCLSLELKGTLDTKRKESISLYYQTNRKAFLCYQYLLLFYRLQKKNGNQADWTHIGSQYIKLEQFGSGIFCLSGFVLNLIDPNSLLKEFQNWMREELKGMKAFEEMEASEQEKILKPLLIPANEELLLPIQDVDFIVFMGSEIKRRLGSRGSAMELDSIQRQVQRYFEVMSECLEKYDTVCADKFRNYELVKMILGGDRDFMSLLAKSIMAHATPEDENPQNDDWTEEG